jgi:hypothetical protein
MSFRFGLRSLAALVTMCCVALWAIPTSIQWYEWRHIRLAVNETVAELAAVHDNLQIVMLGHLQPFCLSDHDIEWKSDTESPVSRSFSIRTDAVFVVSPGKPGIWAHSPHEVVRLLKQEFQITPSAMEQRPIGPFESIDLGYADTIQTAQVGHGFYNGDVQ